MYITHLIDYCCEHWRLQINHQKKKDMFSMSTILNLKNNNKSKIHKRVNSFRTEYLFNTNKDINLRHLILIIAD